MRTPEGLAVGRLLSWTALMVTLVVTPWASYDPINVPKLAVISIAGFIAFGALMANWAIWLKKEYRVFVILACGFFVHLTVVLVVSGRNIYQEFFGASGRSTGYLAYVALLMLFVSAGLLASSENLKRVFRSLIIAGILSIAYGLLQTLNLDPAAWSNPYSPVIGFLGNPNFQSSFLGFTGIALFSISLSNKTKRYQLVINYLVLALCLFTIKETDSQQGFLVLIGGSSIVFLIWVKHSRFNFLTVPSLALVFLSVFLATIGSLNKGPLASLLYKDSVTYRGDYWRAGWKMTLEHPLFGVGLDSYGDWYRRARSLEATLRRGPEIVSNAAHNVFLDFSSTGGFPLLLIYLAMMFLALRAGVKYFSRTRDFDPIFTGLFAVWVAYQAQSLISLNQLGLAIWGWIISGLLIGYEINTRPNVSEPQTANSKKVKSLEQRKNERLKASSILGMFIGLIFGIILGIQPLVASAKYKAAIESGNSQTYIDSVNVFPKDFIRTVQVVQNLENYGFKDQAVEIIRPAAILFPDSYEIWNAFSQLSKATAEELERALKEMKRLDPNNPNLR